jgi:hypothetical protein
MKFNQILAVLAFVGAATAAPVAVTEAMTNSDWATGSQLGTSEQI